MEKKRKHSETVVAENEKKERIAPEQPARTFFGLKTCSENIGEDDTSFRFRNKEKVLVTCSRRINFRFIYL